MACSYDCHMRIEPLLLSHNWEKLLNVTVNFENWDDKSSI